uniref:Uncharacterized protein n=1 Tax=Triticum urartu TaxID=4572 RepID=A0A8R7K410_TRIUA
MIGMSYVQSMAAPIFKNSYLRADVLVTTVVFKFFKFKGGYLAEGRDIAGGEYCQAKDPYIVALVVD